MAGQRVKFLYTIPNFQNPAGILMSEQRREELLEIAVEYDLLIVEDDPYALLGFESEPARALRARDADRVIYLGSFSKTFAPGLRVGWAVAPHGVREKLVLASEAQILCPPTFSQLAVSTYLSTQPWKEQVKVFRELYRERRDAVIAALTAHMPSGVSWTYPHGGFFVWVQLPGGIAAKALQARAVSARVACVPGIAFYADGSGGSPMRLSYCFPTPERITAGVRRLAAVLQHEVELRETFGKTYHEGPHPSDGSRSYAPAPDMA